MRTAKQLAAEKNARTAMRQIETEALRQRARVTVEALQFETSRILELLDSMATNDRIPFVTDVNRLDELHRDVRRVWMDYAMHRDDAMWKETERLERRDSPIPYRVIHSAEKINCDICEEFIGNAGDAVSSRCDRCLNHVGNAIQAGMSLSEAVKYVREFMQSSIDLSDTPTGIVSIRR